jgi:hypothetical protein
MNAELVDVADYQPRLGCGPFWILVLWLRRNAQPRRRFGLLRSVHALEGRKFAE